MVDQGMYTNDVAMVRQGWENKFSSNFYLHRIVVAQLVHGR